MSVYIANDTDLTAVADAIRSKANTANPLTFPNGFVSAIDGLSTGIPKATKIKYIIPATYIPKRTSDDLGFDVISFTFTRENVNQLMCVNWRLQDATDFSVGGYWVQSIIWNLFYQGNAQSVNMFLCIYNSAGNMGNSNINQLGTMPKTALTASMSWTKNVGSSESYKRHGTTYKGLIFIYDSTYDGAPIVDETKLTQFFTNCNGQLTAGM